MPLTELPLGTGRGDGSSGQRRDLSLKNVPCGLHVFHEDAHIAVMKVSKTFGKFQ